MHQAMQAELTTSGHISRNETWEARSTGVAAINVVTFCIHTEISTQLAFIDIWKEEVSSVTVQKCINKVNIIGICVVCTSHDCVTCAVESISLIARVTAAVVTSNGIDAVSISITVIETTQLTLINI